jgi:predicted metal-binding protein
MKQWTMWWFLVCLLACSGCQGTTLKVKKQTLKVERPDRVWFGLNTQRWNCKKTSKKQALCRPARKK